MPICAWKPRRKLVYARRFLRLPRTQESNIARGALASGNNFPSYGA